MSEYPSYLIHYGIQGQKWGVRRFQNEDGTYTSEGLMRRREEKHFVAEQRRTGKQFDKVTKKIQKDQAKGKEVSEKRINKAVELGTKHRALDYISQNPRAYLKAHGLNKGSGAKYGMAIAANTYAAGFTTAVNPLMGLGAIPAAAKGITMASIERKLEKKFLKDWMQRQYGDVIAKSRNLTIKDLEQHGIKVKSKQEENKIEQDVNQVKTGVSTAAKGVGNVTKSAWRATRTAGSSAGSLIKGTVKGIGSGVKTVAKGGDLDQAGRNFSNEAKLGAQNAQAKIVRNKENVYNPLNDGVKQIGSGTVNTAVGVGKTARDTTQEIKKKKKK